MAEITTEEVRAFLSTVQGQTITLKELRDEFNLLSGSKSFEGMRTIMSRAAVDKIVRINGRGLYRVVKQVKPVQVYGKERRKPVELNFPRDFSTDMELLFAEDIILREGDLLLISGRSNYGKTQMCMEFCGRNIKKNPVLMGNEYTTLDDEPAPRFLNRLDNMDWIEWVNGTGEDKFTLLPVHADYAEHIIKDRINIIDWINIETGEHYMIGRVMEDIKRELGKGIAIIAIQKAEGAESGRGGQFTKDFADVEILLDAFGEDEVMLTLGKIKESHRRVTGRKFAYYIQGGVKIMNFREVVKCPTCFGKGWKKEGNSSKPCPDCFKKGYVDK